MKMELKSIKKYKEGSKGISIKTSFADGTKKVKKTNSPIATGNDPEKQDAARTLIGQGQKPKKVGQEGYEKDVAERNARLTKYAKSSPEKKEVAIATSTKANDLSKSSSSKVLSVVSKESSANKTPNKGLDTYIAKKQAVENKNKDSESANPNIDRKSAITAINNKEVKKKKADGVKKMVLIKKSK